MGEYALFGGEEVKIGTCEDMYYLRFDQRHLVKHVPNNVNVMDPKHFKALRFRFPFPDEDGVPPGSFSNYNRGLRVDGVRIPTAIEHREVQFTADAGYVVSIPCPESEEAKSLQLEFHKNGWRGDVFIRQQRVWEGRLVLVAECGGCGALFRLPTLADAAPVVEYCINQADAFLKKGDMAEADWWKKIAERVIQGYNNPI